MFSFSDLKSQNWDAADEIHRGLMVDNVSEVSQWMVGVKHLIAEARSLKPELFESAELNQNQIDENAESGS